MTQDLVRHSRAGDVFHYRWAARRCLKLIYPDTSLRKVVIEGSSENAKAGEYVIDVSEYYERDSQKSIKYYQLKHSDLQLDKPFTLSTLKSTIEGFAKRFIQHYRTDIYPSDLNKIDFSVITNRPIDSTVKANIVKISNGEPVNTSFQNTIEKYTNLKESQLSIFCKLLNLEDGQGDYKLQKEELRIELSQVIAGTIKNEHVDTIEALVKEKALPAHKNKGVITQEDILKRYSFTSIQALFPAPPKWEKLNKSITRIQYLNLKEAILGKESPFIIHAGGGVGKSVFTRQFKSYIDEGSLVITYDCFGAGNYRNRSTSRHRHRDGLVQIANELATQGLCSPLLALDTASASDITRMFLLSVSTSIAALKRNIPTAKLFILIDAADNAEMAAKEFNEDCFAHEILNEDFPDDCKLIMLCRTERIELLQPRSNVTHLLLDSFSEEESLANLQGHYPEATNEDGQEFHRRTAGNPRVQANALDIRVQTVNELLDSLAPSGTTVEDQINMQLQNAVDRVKLSLTREYEQYIDSICTGLASLPPFIPIHVLAEVAGVSSDFVKSFVSDIGRSIWLVDSSVQFIDEPTETWFRDRFIGKKRDYENYIDKLEPVAEASAYVSGTLPQLYLQAGQESKLIDIALSDKFLPKNNPLDERNVRIYRLQFAFRAALRKSRHKDAAILAMRAGEEVAGDARQHSLLLSNTDLFVALLSRDKVQEIGFRRLLHSQWEGSENLYSASLFSYIKEFQGDARVFLRSALNWCDMYIREFENSKKKDKYSRLDIDEQDFLEFAYTIYNLDGVESLFHFLKRLHKYSASSTLRSLVRRLIEQSRFDDIDLIQAQVNQDPNYILVITAELFPIGHYPNLSLLQVCLDSLTKGEIETDSNPFRYDNPIYQTIITFLDCCIANGLDGDLIPVLNRYFPLRVSQLFTSDHDSKERTTFLKALAIRLHFGYISEVDMEEIIPKVFLDRKKHDDERKIEEFKEIINGLLPWYLTRVKVLAGALMDLSAEFDATFLKSSDVIKNRYRNYDPLPSEIIQIQISILIHHKNFASDEVGKFCTKYLWDNKDFYLTYQISLVRSASYVKHLESIRPMMEKSAASVISSSTNDGPERISGYYVDLSRAVISHSRHDSSYYFNKAIEIVSKFGDEINERWDAMSTLANQASNFDRRAEEIAYRYIRCAEVVGENVEDKHWNRSDAIVICSRLATGAGISALSRWRDRDIGYFDEMIKGLIKELLEKKKISISVGWSLGRLISHPYLNEIVEICLNSDGEKLAKEQIVDDSISLLQNHGCNGRYWIELCEICTKNELSNNKLKELVDFHNSLPKKEEKKIKHIYKERFQIDWDSIFSEANILTIEGLSKANDKLKSVELHAYGFHRDFWNQVISRISEDDIFQLIECVLCSDFITFYDFKDLFKSIPVIWKSKVSFTHKWPDLVKRISFRFAYDLTSNCSFTYFTESIGIEPALFSYLQDGVIERLAASNEFNDAKVFFGFVAIIGKFLTPQESYDVLAYSIERFEIHIEDDYADGLWQPWLITPIEADHCIAGFIWSALASPRGEMRWRAVHTVLTLATMESKEVFDKLFTWMENGSVDAFGSKKYTFYNLHARLYLFIALSRISSDKVDLLRKYSFVFSKYSLEQHSLIQKFSRDIAINIEKSYPATYEQSQLESISGVLNSRYPLKRTKWGDTFDTIWHSDNIIEKVKFHFGYDFDKYWYEPLGRIFGVSGKQVVDLAAQVVVKEWAISDEHNGFYQDPRSSLWRSSDERETWHSHGEYPKTDNLDFYHSYHAMFIVSARLLEKMAVVVTSDEPLNPWEDWLSQYFLTRRDGHLLSELRDPLPLRRPYWVGMQNKDSWIKRITYKDFVGALVQEHNDGTWINLNGHWTEIDNDKKETYNISSCLVDIQAAQSLMNSINTCNDPYDYYIPDYEGSEGEIEEPPFILRALLKERNSYKGLDKFDPYGNNIAFPPIQLGDRFSEEFSLIADEEGKKWYITNDTHPSLICESWRGPSDWNNSEPEQSGHRLRATIPFLLDVCVKTKCALIIEVEVKRDNIYSHKEVKEPYKQPKRKIFLLLENGELKDATRSYKLR